MLGQVAFDAVTFGTAANNGQMIAEMAASHKANEVFRLVGLHVTGRNTPERSMARQSLKLPSFLKRKRA